MDNRRISGQLVKIAKLVLSQEDDIQYAAVMLGGSIGQKNIRSKRELKGIPVADLNSVFSELSEAKAKASRMNRDVLTPGEKNYYGLKYVVAEVLDGKYTGK